MKTTNKMKIKLSFGLLILLAVFSCDTQMALGQRLDLAGPDIIIESPEARSVLGYPYETTVTGRISDESGVSRMTVKIQFEQKELDRQWSYSANTGWIITENGNSPAPTWAPYNKTESSKGGVWTWIGESQNNAVWSVDIDIKDIAGKDTPDDGLYIINIQAWDRNGTSDDNSFKTRAFLIDSQKPSVTITQPNLHNRYLEYVNPTSFQIRKGKEAFFEYDENKKEYPELTEINNLHKLLDGDIYQDPNLIGKFITGEFDLRWQIEENNEVSSFDLYLYNANNTVGIDELSETALPSNYLFKHTEEVSQIKFVGNKTITPDDLKENGIKVTEKMTIAAVAVCKDIAGNPNEERILGYFVYWPKADNPWITFTGAMETIVFEDSIGLETKNDLDAKVFMVYPSLTIKATAFHNDGVKEVRYSLHQVEIDITNSEHPKLTGNLTDIYIDGQGPDGKVAIPNPPRFTDATGKQRFSTVFPWEFRPEPRSGYYVVKATVVSTSIDIDPVTGKYKIDPVTGEYVYKSTDKVALFRVQDISFPNFPIEPWPSASDPLFNFIGRANGDPSFTIEDWITEEWKKEGAPADWKNDWRNNLRDDLAHWNDWPDAAAPADHIRISGEVSDATEVTSLTMAWINPKSRNFAAMSQLAYFRDKDYPGWDNAKALTPTGNENATGTENAFYNKTGYTYPYDASNPNRLWKLKVYRIPGFDAYNRIRYKYSVDIPLSQLEIGLNPGDNPLKSQVFLLRVENPDNKCTIITYTPQGDEGVPTITIETVVIERALQPTITLTNTSNDEVRRFADGDIVTINGTWREDSTQYLNIEDYFRKNLSVIVNGDIPIATPANPAALTPADFGTTGTWTTKFTVGPVPAIPVERLRDTLVVSASVSDFGRNAAEAGSAWLIQSDDLRLMRISSSEDDRTYTTGEYIKIFLEFNKAVTLRNPGANPVLNLNTGGIATYISAPDIPSTRHEFRYQVQDGHNTDRLNVSGLNNAESNFEFHRGDPAVEESYEQIRLTNTPGKTGSKDDMEAGFYVRTIPTTTTETEEDYKFTLGASKRLVIDTASPFVTGITANTQAGWYTYNTNTSKGDEIYMTLTFNKPVKIDPDNPPRLTLQVNNGGSTTVQTDTTDIQVSGENITFKYTVKADDHTNDGPIVIAGLATAVNTIQDLAGNNVSWTIDGNLAMRTLTGRVIEARPVATPVVRLLRTNTTADDANAFSQTVNGTTRYGRSNGTLDRNLSNIYDPALWLAIENSDLSYKAFYIEYSLDNGVNWVRAPNTDNLAFNKLLSGDDAIPAGGPYTLIARQVDKAGNRSSIISFPAITFRYNPGDIITRIDSTTSANGTYSANTNPNFVDITVFFRGVNADLPTSGDLPGIYLSGAPYITLDTGAVVTTTVPATLPTGRVTSLTFRYTVQEEHNSPDLNVTGMNIIANDGTTATNGVRFEFATANIPTDNNLANNKDIVVTTGAPNATVATTLTRTNSGDEEWEGTLIIDFNRPVQKGSGDIIIRQQREGYRLPAVLTETQAAKYTSLDDFYSFYSRGTNGFDGVPDTSAKFILNFDTSTIQTPADQTTKPTDAGIGRLTWEFHNTETITLPISSQDVVLSNPSPTTGRMTITLTGTNALQVLGATYDVIIPNEAVIDNLGYTWPAATVTETNRTYARATQGVNRPFVRIDKRIDQDRITSNTGSDTTPALSADYANVRQASAKLDCRTPDSTIRYITTNDTHAANGTGLTDDGWTGGTAWRNRVNGTSSATETNDPTIPDAGDIDGTTGVETFTPGTTANITVGNDQYQGYTWRIRMRGRLGTTDTVNYYDEVAFRTVLTYVLNTPRSNNLGQRLASGDQIWLRGGDAISSSTTPGLPLTWKDDFGTGETSLYGQKKRAGIKLMERTSAASTQLNASTWRYITWEINVNVYFDLMLGRGTGGTPTLVGSGTTAYWTSTGGSNQNANDAWQYGPNQWSPPRGGWAPAKTSYPLVPGKHRWLYHDPVEYSGGGGGYQNWSPEMNTRSTPTVSYTQPDP